MYPRNHNSKYNNEVENDIYIVGDIFPDIA